MTKQNQPFPHRTGNYCFVLFVAVALSLSLATNIRAQTHPGKNYQSGYFVHLFGKDGPSKTSEKKIGFVKMSIKTVERLTLQQPISGTVTDAVTGQPLIGANILVIGTPVGTVSDANGHYNLTAPDGADSLRITYIGYYTQNIAINGRSVINIQMKAKVSQVNQVVVTALGIQQQRRSLGYSTETVQTKELVTTGDQNIVSALQGKLAGVQITNSSGAPGSSSRIIIRGFSSLSPGANNQPLFVVDGIPVDNSTRTGSATVRNLSNRTIDLNPNDIKSVTVLKGAAASALYGVRAANGAIIITTKKGQSGTTRVSFRNTIGLSKVNMWPDLQHKYGHGFGGVYQPNSFWASWGASLEEMRKIDPDVKMYNKFRDAYQTGVKYANNVSVSGGNNLATYYGSLSYLKHTGVIPFTDFKRKTARLTGTINPNDRLHVSTSISFANSGGFRPPGDRFNEELIYWTPTADVTDYMFTKGPLKGTMKGYYNDGASGGNPIYIARYRTYEDNVNHVLGYINPTYNFTDWLSASYRVGLDYYSSQRTGITPGPSGIVGENAISSTGSIREARINNSDFTSTLSLTVRHNITDRLSGKLLLGNNVYMHKYNRVTAIGSDFVTPHYYDLSNVRNVSVGQNIIRRRLMSLYGELTLNYDDYLYLDLTGRNDWSSTLPVENRSFFYPSASLSFVFSDVFDMPNFLSFGKVRASFAQVGKDAPPYSTGITFTAPSRYPLGGQVGFTRSGTIGSPDLQPEVSKSIEIGTNLRFMNDRLGFNFTWYKKNSSHQIIPVPIPVGAGGSTLITNAGSIENRGIEIHLSATPVQTSDVQWDIGINYSRNHSKVTAIREGLTRIFIGSSFGYSTSSASMYLERGLPYGNIYGTTYKRYYPEGQAPKNPLYVDKNAPILIGDDGFPVVNTSHLFVLGNALPDWIGSFRNQISYKGLTFSFLIGIQWGASAYSQYADFFAAFGETKLTLDRNDYRVFKGVTADGKPNTQKVWLGQGLDPEGNIDPSTGEVRDYGAGFYRNVYRGVTANMVMDATFVKLRNIKLAYSLPQSLLQKSPFRNITASVAATNLILYTPWKGFDPESREPGAGSNAVGFTGLGYPGVAGVNFSLNFSF